MQIFRFIYTLGFLCLFPIVVSAYSEQDVDAMLDRLDATLDASSNYVAAKQKRIEGMKTKLRAAKSPEAKYSINMQLYDEYRAYQNDSAVNYLNSDLQIARQLGRKDLEAECLSLIAFQCSTVGRYVESMTLLKKVDTSALKGKGLFYYYRAENHVWGEVGYYAHIPAVRDSAFAESGKYLGLILKSIDKNSWEYKHYLCQDLFNNKKIAEAQKVCDEWIKMTPDTAREFALVAYFEYLIHMSKKEYNDAIYWAARSSICDISHAVMDQASLWSIADYISGRDIERSYKYIRYSWQCAENFGTPSRAAQISPILSVIESEYKAKLDKASTRLKIITTIIAVLAVFLLLMLYYVTRQRHKLAAARNDLRQRNSELADMNKKLSESNGKLKEANDKISSVNSQLHESDQIKEAYIGRFLTICSEYIDRMDKERKTANRLIKAHKIDELYQMTRSTEQKDKDVEDLYGYFDRTFLGIFPSFVDDFNALLKPENRIETEAGRLNTSLRIFALIRLGIDDSSKIAEFLHYSVNTIYNYRARTKNGCIGNRETFEDEVKQLGKVGLE